jgi:hypothetical protein
LRAPSVRKQAPLHRHSAEPPASRASDMLKCHECCSDQISVWGGLWVDFYEGGHREIDEQELDEFEPRFGDSMFCRACGFTWTYGHAS